MAEGERQILGEENYSFAVGVRQCDQRLFQMGKQAVVEAAHRAEFGETVSENVFKVNLGGNIVEEGDEKGDGEGTGLKAPAELQRNQAVEIG